MEDEMTAISDRAILAWVGPMNYRLGRAIVSNGRVLRRMRLGDAIEARCMEMSPPAQRARVRFSGGKISEATCTCAVGEEGRCPHVAATLLVYAKDPAAFATNDGPERDLARRSKSELIELINQLLASQPGPDVFPDPDERTDPVLAAALRIGNLRDPGSYRRHVAHAFQTHEFDYWGAVRVASRLDEFLGKGRQYLDQEDYDNAVFVFSGIATTILDYSETVESLIDLDNGELATALEECVRGVARGISGAAGDSEIRNKGLRSLLEVHLYDACYSSGFFAGKAGELIIERATGAEKALAASWLRANLPTDRSGYHHIHRQLRGRFLLELVDGELDGESILEICRECGLAAEAADLLLSANRSKEALSEVAMAWGPDLSQIAEIFERHGYASDVEPLLAERFEDYQDLKLADWLKRRRFGRGDQAGALPYLECLFASEPSVAGYRELRDIALDTRQWEDIRSGALIELIGKPEYYSLAESFIEEGEIVAAFELAEFSYIGVYSMERLEELVENTAMAHPRVALDLVRRLAEIWIKRSTRQGYRRACGHLVRMRNLSRLLELEAECDGFIAGLRIRFPKRPALHEELSRFGM